MRQKNGNMLAAFMGIVLVVLIFLPVVIKLLQSESKQAVKKRSSTLAFQLAEAAVVKGVSKLSENRENWKKVLSAVPISDYADDRVYSDVSGGSYKINLTLGSTDGSVLVVGKGKDNSTHEVRVVEAEYAAMNPDSALIFNHGYIGNDAMTEDLRVHWGAVRSYGECKYPLRYPAPRLYSVGATKRDADPAPPNTNNVDNWSFQTNMGAPPFPDLAYYKAKAINSIVPETTATGEITRSDSQPLVRNPPDSGYFQESLNPGKQISIDKKSILPEGLGNHYEFRSSTSVLYFEASSWATTVYIKRAFLDVEAVIAPTGYVALWNYDTPFLIFGATIPTTAPVHYQGTTIWNPLYPVTGQSEWSANFAGAYAQPNHCCYNIPNVQIHGYFYGALHSWEGKSKVVGVVQSDQLNCIFRDGDWIYFDPAVLKKIVWITSPLSLLSWKETTRSW